MSYNIPNKVYSPIGTGWANMTRRAVSFRRGADFTLRHLSFIGRRAYNVNLFYGHTLVTVPYLIWEIRTGSLVGDPNRPAVTPESLLATGTFDYRYSSIWGTFRPVKYTINLPRPLQLQGNTDYFLIIRIPEDAIWLNHPFEWAHTYVDGSPGEVNPNVWSTVYEGALGVWEPGDNTYNLTLFDLDEQAGVGWHVVLDGEGYMQPDNMRGYRCEQISSGLAETRGGQSEYSQLRYPYSNFSQSDWLGGAGQLMQQDMSSFLYSMSADTAVPQQVILGPLVHRTGIEPSPMNPSWEPVDLLARFLPDSEFGTNVNPVRLFSQRFEAPFGGIQADTVSVRVNRAPWQYIYSVQVGIFEDDGLGNPDFGAGPIGAGWQTIDAPTYKWHWRTVPVNAALASAEIYHVVVFAQQLYHSLPEFRVFFSHDPIPGDPALYSDDLGTTWTALDQSMAFRINDGFAAQMDSDVQCLGYGRHAGNRELWCATELGVYLWREAFGSWGDRQEFIMGDDGTLDPSQHDLLSPATDISFFHNHILVAQGWDAPMRMMEGIPFWRMLGTELVSGGEFEDVVDLDEWDEHDCDATWHANGYDGSEGYVQIETTTAGEFGNIRQERTVVGGRWYEISVWVRQGTHQGFVTVGETPTGIEYFQSAPVGAPAFWTPVMGVFYVPEGEDTIHILLGNMGNAIGNTVHFDQVRLKEVPAVQDFHIGRGYLWASTGPNTVRRTNFLDGWSAEITVGEDAWNITGFVNFQGKLLVGKENGIWEIDENDIAIEYLRFDQNAHPDNCKGMTVWNGMLFIPVQNSIWRWQGSQYREVGPTDTLAGPTRGWPNKITRMASTAPLLWASAEPQVPAGWGGLMAYNGIGWHHIATATATDMSANDVLVTTDLGHEEVRVWWTEGPWVTYVRYPDYINNRWDWDFADYDITCGSVVHSWWDGGLKDALKFWNRVTVIADIPKGTFIEVYAIADGQEWIGSQDHKYLGTLYPETQTETGEYVLMFSDGLVAKTMQIIFVLNTLSVYKTPRIKAFNVESVVRQPPVYVYTFRILLADNITKLDRTTEDRTANQMWEELQRAAAQDSPILVSFPDKTFRGMISFLTEETFMFKPAGMEEDTWERIAVVNVVEAT